MNDDTEIDREAQALRRADRFGAYVAIRPDRSHPDAGPLAGVRVAVKDNIAVAGLPFTAGHPVFANRVAAEDAAAVACLRAAGARVMGVTRTDAGGFGVTTPEVLHPTTRGVTVGGSSGGAAAAVAAGLADLGLGTDTGGSVRIPAACCDLFAFKPTHGRVALRGVWPLAPTLDHIGLLARRFDVLVAGASSLLGARPPDGVAKPRFGIDRGRLQQCDPDVAANFLASVEKIEQAGFDVTAVTLPDRDAMVATHATLVLAEARITYAELWPTAAAQLGEAARQALSIADRLDARAIELAGLSAGEISDVLSRAFNHVDAILTPTLPVAPPPAEARSVMLCGRKVPTVTALVTETCLANVAGTPALVIPFAACAGDQPVSMQLMAPRHQDAALLRYGASLHALAACRPLFRTT